jgi:hypothetical protein
MVGEFPQYFRQEGTEMRSISEESVPTETGLIAAKFLPPIENQSYTSPDANDDVWHKPGPKAGPFTAHLTDGSTVTYYWYRFIDQPSLQDADLSEVEKARLQHIVEKIQANWTPEKQYMPQPRRGMLASLDPALLVKPPKGLSVGYVPIVTNQTSRSATR